jgi:hypothetical protein
MTQNTKLKQMPTKSGEWLEARPAQGLQAEC